MSNNTDNRATGVTYAHAMSGEYDQAHEQALRQAITTAIAEVSITTDAGVRVIPTAETCEALISVLAGILARALAARSPTETRQIVDAVAERLRQKIDENARH